MRKKILVLGASSGIGRAIAERFAKEGWQVLLTGTESNQCEAVLDSLPGEGHQAYVLDVRSQPDIQRLGQQVQQALGPVDAFVNSIGISQNVPLTESDFTTWDNELFYRFVRHRPPAQAVLRKIRHLTL